MLSAAAPAKAISDVWGTVGWSDFGLLCASRRGPKPCVSNWHLLASFGVLGCQLAGPGVFWRLLASFRFFFARLSSLVPDGSLVLWQAVYSSLAGRPWLWRARSDDLCPRSLSRMFFVFDNLCLRLCSPGRVVDAQSLDGLRYFGCSGLWGGTLNGERELR